MLKELAAFYERQGIHSLNFRCPWYRACSANSPQFTTATASFVGPRYGERSVPRLLFLSQDSGSDVSEPDEGTPEGVSDRVLAMGMGPKNAHWYRTHELAHRLLGQFKPELTIPDTRLYFAHANSAKCCQNGVDGTPTDSILFENCRRFIQGELRILKPDVVVTQGGKAKDAISALAHPPSVRETKAINPRTQRPYKLSARCETGFLELKPDVQALWFHTYLPNNFGRFNPQRQHCWSMYAKEVARFWKPEQRGHGR